MLISPKRWWPILGASLVCLAAGCGGASRSPTPDDPMEGVVLTEVGEAYRAYTLFKGAPPSQLADFDKLKNLSPTGIAAIKRGEVIVLWGAKLPDTGEEPGPTTAPEVLAYQKRVPDQGGYVLQLDRRIRKMTADEFKAAPKAGKG